MIYRKLDKNGDRIFGGNKNDFYSDIDAVKQAVTTRLKLLKNEWWEDFTEGLPFFESLLGSKNIDAVKNIIAERIKKTAGVKNVSDSFLEIIDGKAVFTCRICTDYGNTEIQEVLL